MERKIQVLDCTLRDGGQGLIDINGSGIKTESFTNDEKIKIANSIIQSGIDIIEIGCIDETPEPDRSMYALYEDVKSMCGFLPEKKMENQLRAGLFIGPDGGIEIVPDYQNGMCECLRVILRYSELQKSLDFCKGLAQKGYKVFVQPMLTMRYTNDELDRIIYAANEMHAYALYFVDSYGYMEKEDVKRLYDYYSERLDKNINIGFHAHNNMHMAFENAKYFLDISEERDVIVDSCVMGMGQGAGNLQTELILSYLNKKFEKDYILENILDVCDVLEKFKKNEMESWGYSPLRLIPALFNTAYKYASCLKINYHMSLRNIYHIIRDMPDDMRHRYTISNVEELLRNANIG